MGFFSWNTSDTNKSISNQFSSRGALKVYMYLPDGQIIYEPNYDGYGIFGGIDVYAQIDKQNGGKGDRDNGISMIFDDNPTGEFTFAEMKGIKTVRFSQSKDKEYAKLLPPRDCKYQGFFYD